MQFQSNKPLALADDHWPGADHQAGLFDVDRLLGIVRRQWPLVALAAAVGFVLGIVYILNATPLYTARTSVLIDRGSNALVTQLSSLESVLDDEGTVLSQVELLQSRSIASRTVVKNKLDEDPVFMLNRTSLLGSIRRGVYGLLVAMGISSPPTLTEDEIDARRDDAVSTLLANTTVERVGRTYVLAISYTSPSPELSARVANAIGEAYLTDKLDSKFEATRRATNWMQERIAELRQRAVESDLAVQKFRTANDLVSTGTQLVTDQRLSELNTALSAARAATFRARANYDRLQDIIKSNDVNAIVPEALESRTITDLRTKYLEVAKIQAELERKLGPTHIQVVRTKEEMAEYQRQMFGELNRIAQSYKSQLDVAQKQENDLTDSVVEASGISANSNETQVQARELEREAETYANLYKSFLERYQQAVQQQTFPVTDARIISGAILPDRPSAPKKPMVLVLFMIMGAAAGGLFGIFREYRDRFFRTGEQLRDELGLELLGIAPLVSVTDSGVKKDKKTESLPANVLLMRKTTPIADYVVDHPLSAFAESMRSAKIAADLSLPSKHCKVIGVVSTLPDEGKSTVAINFAELLANQGARTLLIDADIRNPDATRTLAAHAERGLLEALLSGQPAQEMLHFNPHSLLAFLPAVIKQRVPHSAELLASGDMKKLLILLGSKFDYIVLDLPPLAPVVDARAMTSLIDGFLFVVEWGKTARRTVRQTLVAEPRIAEKCLGVILNKVDMEKMKLYQTYGSIEHYFSQYSKYYQEQ